MNLIRDIYASKMAINRPVVSFELFPPKTDEGERNLIEKVLPELLALKPDYCSVTYGAGGSGQEKTLRIVEQIQLRHHLMTLAHLTCVNSTKEQISSIVRKFQALGVHNILALRGDPVGNEGAFVKTEGGFEYAYQLVMLLRELGGFGVGVAGFPEGHIACKEGKQADWDHLKAKIDCGADFVITQLFFDNKHFFEMRDYLTRKGIKIPLVPGIIPILSANQIKKFTALCGAELPAQLLSDLDKCAVDDDSAVQFGIDYATRQCADLLKAGAPGIHFYTLNKSHSTGQILKNLKLTP